MLKYFQTTTLILAWCFILSVVWSGLVWKWVTLRSRVMPVMPKTSGALRSRLLLPALVIAPLALAGFYHGLGLNLLYPIHAFASSGELLMAAIIPALVLVLSSGLFTTLRDSIRMDFMHWRCRPFSLTLVAYGYSLPGRLRRLVLLRSLVRGWNQCLPWLFGELIIVEAVFNAPGLGLDCWNLAKMKEYSGLLQSLIWLTALYGVCAFLSAMVSGWIGRRLKSYGG